MYFVDFHIKKCETMATKFIFSNKFVLLVALQCIIESLTSILIALLGIQVYECRINPFLKLEYNTPENLNWWETVHYLTYLTYFRNGCSWFRLGDEWSEYVPTVYRTYKWLIIYLILSGFWMLTSFLMIIALRRKKKINYHEGFYLCYPWILITTTVIFVDTFASIQYLFDLGHTSDMKQYFQFIGFKGNFSNVPKIYLSAQTYTTNTPPILMSILFSKGVVLWILNVIVVILIYKITRCSHEKQDTNNKSLKTISNQYRNGLGNEDVRSQTSEVLADLSSSTMDDTNYVPWMDVLYLPSICEESNDETEDTIPVTQLDEHQYEHQYEHVTCPNDMPNIINIEIPSDFNTDPPTFNRMTPYYRNASQPKFIKIEISNLSIKVQQKNPRPFPLSKNYRNSQVIREPNVTPKCCGLNCTVHGKNWDPTSQ